MPQRSRAPLALIASVIGPPDIGVAASVVELAPVEVVESADNLLGSADSANSGIVTRKQLDARPIYRPGEMFEAATGLIVTQHSGEGKANQYFLRGINIDHGTDLAITVDGMPVNQRTHAHGQGYSDVNFVIPELVGRLEYRKGPYYADEGDFSAAGAIHVLFQDRLEKGFGELGTGGFGYRRALIANAPKLGDGMLLYGIELFHNDGPWTRPDDFRKANGMLRYAQGTRENGFTITGLAYQGNWNATNQIPQRAIDLGLIGRFDTLDPSDGGESSRYSLSGTWARTGSNTVSSANAYVVRYRLNLWSNFTFLDDNNRSAQIEQSDQRVTSGFHLRHAWLGMWGTREMENIVGVQARNDHLGAGLFNAVQRQRVSTTRDDHVVESSAATYYENRLRWTEWMRTIAGLRWDDYWGEVTSDTPANSGKAHDHILNPKLSAVFGPWSSTEYYVSYGRGFRSNDLRGATITVAPGNPGTTVVREPLLVRATGYEAGVRSSAIPRLRSTLSVFALDFDSELLFQGNTGTTTDTGRPSRRVGFEFSNEYSASAWLLLNADIAYTRARFRDSDVRGVGNHVPQAIEGVATMSAAVDHIGPYFGSVRIRYLGPRPLIEDNSVRSKSTTLVSARAGYRLRKDVKVQVDAFNLLNRQVSQIDYFYASRPFPTDPPGGVNSVHSHPAEPRSVRVAFIANF